MEPLGVVIPSRQRPNILLSCLDQLSSFDNADVLDVSIAVDDDLETYEAALDFSNSKFFHTYVVSNTPGRVYSVKAFNLAAEKCIADKFVWIGDDAVFPKNGWIDVYIKSFNEAFPDGIGCFGSCASGAALGMISKSFIKLNNNEFYSPEYNVHWADVELGLRAIMLGRYNFFSDKIGIGHHRDWSEKYSNIDSSLKYTLGKEDKKIFSERLECDFYLDKNKIINPIVFNDDFHYSRVCMPLGMKRG